MALVLNTRCAVPGCKVPQSEVPGLKYHKFPQQKQKSRREAFLRFCLLNNHPGRYLIICSAHFPDEAYELSGRVLGWERRDWRLNPDAVPTLFPPPGYVPEEVAEVEVEELYMEVDPIIEEEEIIELVPSDQCRLCLDMVDSEDPRSVSLFDITTKGRDSLSGELLRNFRLKLEPSPQWPSIACSKCVNFMHQMRRFREQIMTSHRLLYKEIVVEAMNVEEIETEIQQEDLPEELETNPNDVVSSEAEASAANEEMLIEFEPRRLPRDLEREEELEKEICTKGLLNCGECGKEEFQTLKDLHNHQVDEHLLSVGYISCCSGKFNIYKSAFDHMEYHQDPERFKCAPCDKQFMSGYHLQEHNRQKHGRKFQCRTCMKMLTDRGKLRIHEATHLPIEQRPFKCTYCPKRFPDTQSLRRHVERMHEIEERHVCEICGKKFSNGGTLWQHRQGHKGRGTEKSLLRTRTTTKNKTRSNLCKDPCPVCGRKVVNLQKHITNVHEDNKTEASAEDLELLNCIYCSESVQRVEMSIHMRTTHDRKFMECKLCRIQFKSGGHFYEHKNRHNNVVFECDYCDKVCITANAKYLHVRCHHPEEFQMRRLQRTQKKEAEEKISG